MIYFDHAATSIHKPKEVATAVYEAIQTMGNGARGAHEASLDAARTIYATREKLAQLFHAEDASRIAFTSNATESLNIAIHGSLLPGDHVITTQLEHNSVLRPLYAMEERGVELTVLPSDEKGCIDAHQVREAIKETTKLVIVTHASNVTGNVVDIEAIGNICREANVWFAVDASQTAGAVPIDVESCHIDILCFTGHKGLLGPQGTGGIYVRQGIHLRPLKQGGSGFQTFSRIHPTRMPECLEAGTLNGHGIAGLHAGVSYVMQTGIEAIRSAEQARMWQFYEGIKEIPSVVVYGDFTTTNRTAIVSFNLGDYDSSEVSDALAQEYGIYTRAGGHCAPQMHEALGTREQGAVRFSFSHKNTEEEVATAIRAIQQLAMEIEG